MKLIKVITFCITLGMVAYNSLVLLKPYVGFPPDEICITILINLPISIVAFVLSDLWLHNNKMRIIGIVVFVSLCLFSVKDYRKSCDESFKEDIRLGLIASAECFEYYWKLNGLFISYQIV